MRIRNFCLKRKYGFISFAVAAISMWLMLAYVGLVGTGQYSLIDGDMLENYIPAIKNLCRDIFSGESFDYSWNMCMGMNTTLYNAYYAYNPFNLLYLLFYNADDNAVTAFIIVFKTGLAAFFMQRFIANRSKTIDFWSVVFSVLYSMCSFQVTYNVMNIIWLDAMFILPIVIDSIYKLVDENKRTGLLFALVYIFTVQFYMGYMLGIASAVFLFAYLISKRRKITISHSMRIVGVFSLVFLLAVGTSAIVWLPAAMFLMNNNPSDASAFTGIGGNLFDLFSRFFIGEVDGIYDYKPNVFCGVLSLIGVPAFFIGSKVQRKEKEVWGIFGAFLCISCVIAPLYIMWHGFDTPDGWGYRFAYIICFTACIMAAEAFGYEDGTLFRKLVVIAILEIVLYCLYKWLKSECDLHLIGINIVAIAIWLIVLLTYERFELKESSLIKILIVLLVSVECIYNGHLAYISCADLHPNLWRVMFDTWNCSEKNAADTLNEDSSFFRVNYLYDYGINSATYYGFNSISNFSSAENPNVRYTMASLGLNSSPRMLLNHGLTDVTKTLFDIKYDVIGSVLKENMSKEDYYPNVLINDETLAIGYMVDNEILDCNLKGPNAFENNNILLSMIAGEGIQAFNPISVEDVYISGTGINLENSEVGYDFVVDDTNLSDTDRNITFHITGLPEEKVYAYMCNRVSARRGDSAGLLLDGGAENSIYHRGFVSTPYIKELQKEGKEKILRVTVNGSVTSQHVDDILFYSYDEDVLHKLYERISSNQLIVTEFGDGYISGHISTDGKRKVFFTSIPYDKGWRLEIDGKNEQIIPVINNTFIGAILPEEGKHDIKLSFTAEGRNLSIAISGLSIIWVFMTIYKEKINNLKKN